MTIQDKWQQLIADWRGSIEADLDAHSQASQRYASWNQWLILTTVILTATTGTALFATVSESQFSWMRWLAGGISCVATVLVAVQSQAGYATAAEKHRLAVSRIRSFQSALRYREHLPPRTKKEADEYFDLLSRFHADIPPPPQRTTSPPPSPLFRMIGWLVLPATLLTVLFLVRFFWLDIHRWAMHYYQSPLGSAGPEGDPNPTSPSGLLLLTILALGLMLLVVGSIVLFLRYPQSLHGKRMLPTSAVASFKAAWEEELESEQQPANEPLSE